MGIVNRRNAVLGWAVWTGVKKVAKLKARAAVWDDHTGMTRSAIATIAATIGGVLLFWRMKSGSSTAE